MKYYIIAGEASGDLHGSNLIKELKKADPGAEFRGWGGDLMQAAGMILVKHYKDLAFMGFVEVARNLRTIFRNLRACKEDILQYQPDALILVDYPGFNLRIVKWAHLQRISASAARSRGSSLSPHSGAGNSSHSPNPAAPSPTPTIPPSPNPQPPSSPPHRAQNFRIIYYISPQVWAWKESRVRQIKECVDKMLVILPFEKEFYHKWKVEVEYVGHPLVEVIDAFRAEHPGQPTAAGSPNSGNTSVTAGSATNAAGANSSSPFRGPADTKPIIALLPGSRKQEILKKLPIMLEVSRSFPDYQFVVAQAPGQDKSFYKALVEAYPNVSSVSNQTYSLLSTARAACVTSGTATLETALFGVPEVVCYKGSSISYQIAKRLIRVKYISLVNLIMDKLVVKELIQDELTPENLRRELEDLLHNPQRQQQLQTDYRNLKDLLSQGGHASANAAANIVGFLRG